MSSDRDRRREQRQKELEAKRNKLKNLIAENQTPVVEEKSGPLDLTAIDNVDDLLKSLESTNIVVPPKIERPEIPTDDIPKSHKTTNTASETSSTEAPAKPTDTTQLSVQLNILVHDIAPKEIEVYTRGTQTESDLTEIESEPEKPIHPPKSFSRKTDEQSLDKTDSSSSTEEQSVSSTQTGTSDKTQKEKQIPTVEFVSKEDEANLLRSKPFVDFFDTASKALERALYVESRYGDPLTDYSLQDEDDPDNFDDDSGTSDGQRSRGKPKIRLLQTLSDPRWTKHRSVTDLAWSPKFPELLAVSYSAGPDSITGVGPTSALGTSYDPDGVVCLWSVHNTLQRPEYVFTCQSQVMSVLLPQYHPTLVVGGTYSGQIVLWDTRAKTAGGGPVQRTPLSSIGHTHPIYCLAGVGTQNANNLVTVSTDGRLCVWNYKNLHQPVEVLELRHKQRSATTGTSSVGSTGAGYTGNIAPTCLGFPDDWEGGGSEVNEFFVGSEDGGVYQAFRHGAKSGVHEQFAGHRGPVTSVAFHPAKGSSAEFSDLFLTSAMDWSCMLWSKKNNNSGIGPRPIYQFEDVDYVYDVAWSPVHPAMFGVVNGAGELEVWNLNDDTEAPVARVNVSHRALACLSWAPDGKKIVVGDSVGSLYVYGLGDFSQPAADESTRLEATLEELLRQAEIS